MLDEPTVTAQLPIREASTGQEVYQSRYQHADHLIRATIPPRHSVISASKTRIYRGTPSLRILNFRY